MGGHLPKAVIIFLLVAVVALPFALRPFAPDRSEATAGGDAAERLVIFTPHNEQIRTEMAAGFNRWRADEGLPPVAFDWRTSGGTSDLRKLVLSQYEAKAAEGRLDEGIGADLFFGGGDYDHGKLASGIKVDGRSETVAVAPDLPEGLLAEALHGGRAADLSAGPSEIGGEQLYHPERLWVGTTLSSFGIVYNKDVLSMLGLDEPTAWVDLTGERYAGWVALADPSHSGSAGAAYEAILQRRGWIDGWATIRRLSANARYFTDSSSKVPVDVSQGEAAAGMAIDFYGRTQVGAVAKDGVSRLGYVNPTMVRNGKRVSMTATGPDPITILRGTRHHALASQFVAWLLSKEGQRLWQLKRGEPAGPVKFELRRQPIRADLYTAGERARWTDPEVDPFETAQPMPDGLPGLFGQVTPVIKAMAIDTKDGLDAAWAAIRETPPGPLRDRMIAQFDAMPADLRLPWTPLTPDEARAALRDADHPRHAEAAVLFEARSALPADRYDADRVKTLRKALTDTRDKLHGEAVAAFADHAVPDGWPVPMSSAEGDRAFRDPSHPRHADAVLAHAAFVARWNADFGGGDRLLLAQLRWTDFFRDSYEKVSEMAE